jgi:lysyl-tRNA synthetase, class I
MTYSADLAKTARAWPFEEARKLVQRFAKAPSAKGYVLLETGYGPSGLPHIGTFGEVARTTMVAQAFALMSDIPTKILCFSDDMDGLRKVPDNVPNKEMMQQFIGKPLTVVPDPFGTHESFGAHNNARLRKFLDQFKFQYEFVSSTDYYKSGKFDATLLNLLAQFDDVMKIILPTLGPDRAATYSPFLPICPKTGIVLQEPMIARDVANGTVTYIDPNDGETMTVPVTGGHCKLQWKADWAMRWVALDVDYEMAGKDLTDSVSLSGKIARALGAKPPEGFNYELFLDQNGQKISKSKGNGLTIEEWLKYASPESLSLYMYTKPKEAKRLYFDVIPRAVDDYTQHVAGFAKQTPEQQLGNPAWHIHGGAPPALEFPISFGLLLNLVGASGTSDKNVVWGYISGYAPGMTAKTHPHIDQQVNYALAYFHDFIAPTLHRRAPTETERTGLADLAQRLEIMPLNASSNDLMNEVYASGRAAGFEEKTMRAWFQALYETMLGSQQGPRMGSFIALYGVTETIALIQDTLKLEAVN